MIEELIRQGLSEFEIIQWYQEHYRMTAEQATFIYALETGKSQGNNLIVEDGKERRYRSVFLED